MNTTKDVGSTNTSSTKVSEELITSLQDNFPINYKSPSKFKTFYPFSNEQGYGLLINNLKLIDIKSKKLRVAILFGESNFLSMLPFLPADLILLADVNLSVLNHNRFLLQCFSSANTPEEFIKFFSKDNPELEYFESIFDENKISLGKYYFLNSQNNFDRCKQAFTKLKILRIQFDLESTSQSDLMSTTLQNNNAVITFCNFTNIYHHVDWLWFSESINLLLKYSSNCLVMHPVFLYHQLRTFIRVGANQYLAAIKNSSYDFSKDDSHQAEISVFKNALSTQKNTILSLCHNQDVFFKPKKVKSRPSEIHYAGIYNNGVEITENDVSAFLKGELFLPSGTVVMPMNPTFELADDCMKHILKKDDIKNSTNPYWILVFRGKKPYLEELTKNRDLLSNMFETIPRIVSATNNTRTMTIAGLAKENLGVQPEIGAKFINHC